MLVEVAGDFDGGHAPIGEVVDLAGQWVGGVAPGLWWRGLSGGWRRGVGAAGGGFEASESIISGGNEVFEAGGLAVEAVGDELSEFLGVVHDGGEIRRWRGGAGVWGRCTRLGPPGEQPAERVGESKAERIAQDDDSGDDQADGEALEQGGVGEHGGRMGHRGPHPIIGR